MKVEVRSGNLDRAIKVLQRKMAQEGIFKQLRQRSFYQKPSDKRRRKKREAVRRARKNSK